MRPRVIIAGQTGLILGLIGLAFFQSRLLDDLRTEIAESTRPSVVLPPAPVARPSRLRLQQLPPIQIRSDGQRIDWKSVESEDYATYVENLRAIGCPEETIRDIIVADVNQLFDERRRAVDGPSTDWEYWRHPDEAERKSGLSDAARDREAELADLERERRGLLVDLLGRSFLDTELSQFAREHLQDRSLQFLDPVKREAVAAARARYAQAQAELATLITDPEAHEARSRAAEEELEAAMSQALTPEEREQLDMRSGSLSDGIREGLRGFGATKEEFEKIYRLEKAFADERVALEKAGSAGTEKQAAEKIEAGEIELQAKLKAALGDARFAEYQRAHDPEYQTLFSLAREHDVSPNVAAEVIGMRQTVKEHADRIRQNPLLTVEQKTRALQAIRMETAAAVVDVLGEPLLHEYQRVGGNWLVELTEPRDLGESGVPIIPPPLPPIGQPNP